MFGYISINKEEMKFKDFDVYHSFYCGLCRKLKEHYGKCGQMTLSYDMTFLVVLLSGLYEPLTAVESCRCTAHPLQKHEERINEHTDYVADMNIILSYYKCKDDWNDERKYRKYVYAKLLSSRSKELADTHREKIKRIASLLKKVSEGEAAKETDIDRMAGYFGSVMAEIFAWRHDEWEESLRKVGFYLGKFIYLMDAYEDIETDREKNLYNPLLPMYGEADFEEQCGRILTMMMAECSREFEKLPILKYVDILRNVLYSGVWCRYEAVKSKRKEEQEKKDARSV